MVRLFRGARGRGAPRPHFMGPPRPGLEHPNFPPPFVRPRPIMRGRMLRGPPAPSRLPGPPLPGLPPRIPGPRPPLGIPPRPLHPVVGPPRRSVPFPIHGPGMPPPVPPRPMPPGPPIHRPGFPIPALGPPMRGLYRGRGRMPRGAGLKRLGSAANGRAKKKPKKEKTEGEFFCESCDRGWKTQEKLDEHLAEHEVCGRDGCTFTGHPKIILKHVQFQHDSGLFHKIVTTKNPDDVAKWIAERKSRFPTVAQVEKKKAQEKEMFERGERIPKQDQRFQKRDNGGHWRNNRRNQNNDCSSNGEFPVKRTRPAMKNKPNDEDKWKDPGAWNGNLPRFPGTAAFPAIDVSEIKKEETHFSDEEESIISTETNNLAVKKPVISSILATLAASYGSEDEDSEDGSNTHNKVYSKSAFNSKVVNNSTIANNAVQSKRTNEGSDSGPDESGIDREDKSNLPIVPGKEDKAKSSMSNQLVEDKKPNDPDQQRQTQKRPSYIPRNQLSLLEKLLKDEIRHERNVILQCVRYVVKNNFFGSSGI